MDIQFLVYFLVYLNPEKKLVYTGIFYKKYWEMKGFSLINN